MNMTAHFLPKRIHCIIGMLLFFALALPGFVVSAQAQSDKIITGTVLDQEGRPIEGALIKIPQTNFETRTKKDGTFLLNTPASADAFIVSAKGKQLQRISIAKKSSFSIRMLPYSSPDENDNENMDITVKQGDAERGLSGTIVDENDKPIERATVKVKNSSAGTATNAIGHFIIVPPKGKSILEISAVGYHSKEVVISAKQTSVEIILSSKTANLDEVVVVGYNTQKKVNLTGAVSSVDFKKVQNVPQSNTINILAGRLPGVSVVQPGGQPGSEGGTINIRGIGTLNDAAPLVIIDGVQSTLTDLGNISPAEVANISVLKDAASSAIYGARGANGVILVTTKDPGRRKLQVNFDAFYGVQSATYLPKYVESWQFMTLQNEATNTATNNFVTYDSLTIERLKAGNFSDTLANTKWPQELFRPAGISRYNISINGGNQAISYQASLGYQNQDGLMANTNAKKYNFRTNVRAQINDKMESGLNLWGYVQNSREPFAGIGNIMLAMNQAFPYVPLKTSNGNYGVYAYPDGRGIANPVLQTQIGRNDLESFKGNIQTYLQWKPIKELRLRTAVTYSYANDFRERFNPTYSYPDLGGTASFVNLNSQLQNVEGQEKQLQWTSTAIYNKILNKKHAFTLLAGHEFVNFKNRQFSATGFKMPSNDLQVLGAAVTDFNVGGSKQAWAINSFFGRLNYVFNDKYLFEANFRADGSSRFPSENRYGYFPSFSGGWIVSKEKFFNALSNSISLFKLRGSWGKTGNDRIGNFSFNQFIELGGFYGIGGALQPAGSINSYANPNIKWESTTATNFGVDLGILKNKVIVNFELFDRVTDDILFQLPLPSSFGNVGAPIQNIGSVSNKGWELNLEHRSTIGKNINYSIGVNLSYVKNTIKKLNSQETIYGPGSRYILREGEAINSYYGYVFDGLYRDSADLLKYPSFSTSGFQLGTSILRDVNSDGKIDANDRVILGSANTPYTYGISGSIDYKGFDMSFLLQGVEGKKIFLYDFGNRPGNAANTNFWKEWWDERYDAVNNPDGTWPVLKRAAPEVGQITNSFFLRDASYLRLRNIELGYALPDKFLKRIKIRTFRMYVSGSNLLTFSNLVKQIDPERDALNTGNTSYPQTKVISFGFNLGL